MAAQLDVRGERRRPFAEAARLLVEVPFAEWPVDGPRAREHETRMARALEHEIRTRLRNDAVQVVEADDRDRHPNGFDEHDYDSVSSDL